LTNHPAEAFSRRGETLPDFAVPIRYLPFSALEVPGPSVSLGDGNLTSPIQNMDGAAVAVPPAFLFHPAGLRF